MSENTLNQEDSGEKKRLTKKFGLALAEVRNDAGLTQEQLAEKAEFHRTYIGFIEQGVHTPSIYTIQKLAVALNMKPSELISKID